MRNRLHRRGRRSRVVALLSFLSIVALPALAGAAGARLHKSGPIQVTADGRWVWTVNPDNDSVSRIDTTDDGVEEFILPDAALRHSPRGLAVREDGSEVFVACHDSDRVYVLSGDDGAEIARIDLRWGSGPHSVALSPDQETALVTLHRGGGVAVVDAVARALSTVLEVYQSPLGVAWTEDGESAWVTHLFADEEHPFLTRIAVSGNVPRVTTKITAFATDPRHTGSLEAPYNIAEGGYLTFRGHLAQIPSASGRDELWLPTQYGNITEDIYSPDSTVQSSVRHVDLSERKLLDTNDDKVILTAVHVHSPRNQRYEGPGWNAGVAGPVDIAFSKGGETAYVLHELSGDLVVLPADTPAVKPAGADPLAEIRVGDRPLGLAVSPTAEVAYVMNALSRDVSVVDLEGAVELRRIPATPASGEPLSPVLLEGAKVFHSSADPRISVNEKVACGSCHPGGEHDGRYWAFHRLPGRHGNRPTMSLLGLALSMGPRDPATGWGQLHRSGDRDEVQDFEHNFQGPQMGGTGFLGNDVELELGSPNAGKSAELDALASYVLSLPPLARSPHRSPDGRLTEAAVRGATFFLGTERSRHSADSGCAACHVPETGFTDRKFHDVGDRIFSGNEEELDGRAPAWSANTPTLVGVFATRPYQGASRFQGITGMVSLLQDMAGRARAANAHGTPDGLAGRQLADLAAFVLSIDGDMTAEEVRSARDTSPPRIVRAEPASLTTIDVWFDESVKRGPAEDTANWRLEEAGGAEVPIASARRDSRNGDRVTLGVELAPRTEYRLSALAGIEDMADSASGGAPNRLDPSDPSNQRAITLGSTLTVTLGASGYENITVPVHDAAMIGPGLSTWGHDSVWLFSVNGGPGVNTGFVRFDWSERFSEVSGLTSPGAIIEASFSIVPERGDAQEIELRRALQRWSDPAAGNDFNSNPAGGPTWRDHSHPSGRWNRAGAGRLGGTGATPSDYDAAFDLAASVDATVMLDRIDERVDLGGPKVTEAFRFWFENPSIDYGYALRLVRRSSSLKFERSEHELGHDGPVLRITYALPESGAKKNFVRGDCNGDGGLDVSDPICTLSWLFLGNAAPGCVAATNVNGDAGTDVSDAVWALEFLFSGGPPPREPYPDCGPGTLANDDEQGCETAPERCGG